MHRLPRACVSVLAVLLSLTIVRQVGADSAAVTVSGSVTIAGQGAPAGTTVKALRNNEVCDSATYSGTQYTVSLTSARVSCAAPGTVLTFQVDGWLANEELTVPAAAGQPVTQNLTVGQAPPAPGYTATSSAATPALSGPPPLPALPPHAAIAAPPSTWAAAPALAVPAVVDQQSPAGPAAVSVLPAPVAAAPIAAGEAAVASTTATAGAIPALSTAAGLQSVALGANDLGGYNLNSEDTAVTEPDVQIAHYEASWFAFPSPQGLVVEFLDAWRTLEMAAAYMQVAQPDTDPVYSDTQVYASPSVGEESKAWYQRFQSDTGGAFDHYVVIFRRGNVTVHVEADYTVGTGSLAQTVQYAGIIDNRILAATSNASAPAMDGTSYGG